jgi:hypothetical protein
MQGPEFKAYYHKKFIAILQVQRDKMAIEVRL